MLDDDKEGMDDWDMLGANVFDKLGLENGLIDGDAVRLVVGDILGPRV